MQRLFLSVLVAGAVLACDESEKPAGTGTFKQLREHVARKVMPEADGWQAAEGRIAALGVARQDARRDAAVREAADVLTRWADAVRAAPTPLPLKAPMKRLETALRALAPAASTERDKALEELEMALEDILRRKIEIVSAPLEPLREGDYLTRFWRDLRSLRDLPQIDRRRGPRSPTSGKAVDDPPEDVLASILEGARQAATGSASQAESRAHAFGVQLLQTVIVYRENPPTVDARTLQLVRAGRIGREVIDQAICAAARPLAQRIEAVVRYAEQVTALCAPPGACTPAAADLVYHPLFRELKAVAAKAAQCALPPPAPQGLPPPAPEGLPAPAQGAP